MSSDREPRGRTGVAGFTLVELVVAVAVLGVISLVLVQSVFVALRSTQASAGRLEAAVAAQTLASVFPADVQSADEVSTVDADCAPAGPQRLVRLAWEDAGVPLVASYVLGPASEAGQELVRWSCRPGRDPVGRVLGRFAADGVELSCSPAGTALAGRCPPRPVTVTLTYRDAPAVGTPDPAGEPVRLTALRRTA